jgi:hypothetical protein
MWWIVGGTAAALLAVIHVPSLAAIFRFQVPSAFSLAAACLAGFGSVAWFDVYKRYAFRRPA